MIFSISKLDQESYKERNLYYKIFAGYLFNELLPEYDEKKKLFFNLLIRQINTNQHFDKAFDTKESLKSALTKLSANNLNVSFDYHPTQVIADYKDRGEVSDIIIWGDQYFISIEAKYLSDWSYKKDIEEVQSRITEISKHTKKKGIQVLLIKESKWLNNKKKQKQTGSNYSLLQDNEEQLQVPLIVITWEQILEWIEEPVVKQYLKSQLERKVRN